jgi:uncharacterized protein YgbK (DUF1537 family)
MNHTLHIAVIADDITGAADTGMQFCPAVGPVHMADAIEGELTTKAIQTAGVAVFTHTRHTDAATAAEIVRLVADKIRRLKPQVIYKKMDSCLRGNLGAEIDTLLQATDAMASFVAPAFPQQGRTTVNDCHLINAVPVAETEIGRDPLCPVRESRLSVLMAAQSRMPVGHIPLACIEDGPTALAERVRILLNRGCRHIVFDAERTLHLDAVASLARNNFEKILLAGSAGLAGSLSRIMAHEPPYPAAKERPKIKKWLFVCGSASRVLADQVALLARSTGWVHLTMDPLTLASNDSSTYRGKRGAESADTGCADGVILSIQAIRNAGAAENPSRVVKGLARAAADLLAAGLPQGVFLSGGDTAEAFWHQIGARALLIHEEILPGLMRGEFIGGPHDGIPVVTKAGAFGNVDTLNELVNVLK